MDLGNAQVIHRLITEYTDDVQHDHDGLHVVIHPLGIRSCVLCALDVKFREEATRVQAETQRTRAGYGGPAGADAAPAGESQETENERSRCGASFIEKLVARLKRKRFYVEIPRG